MEKRYYFGIFFLVLQLIAISRNLFIGYVNFFWFCDFAPLFLALGFFLKKDHLIKGVINIGLLPQLIFIFAFMLLVFFDISLFREAGEKLASSLPLIFMTIFVHLSTLIALFLTYKTKPNKTTLKYSFYQIILIYLITVIFTLPYENVNYVFLLTNHFGNNLWTLLAIPISFIILVLPTQFLQYIVWKKFR